MQTLHSADRSGTSAPVGLAGRLGRWSSEHRAKAILGWIVLLLVAVVAAGAGAKLLSNSVPETSARPPEKELRARSLPQ